MSVQDLEQEIETSREEFKYWFKRLRIAQNGAWTPDDESDLQNEMKKIENQASISANIICILIASLFVASVILFAKSMGLF